MLGRIDVFSYKEKVQV